MRAVPTEDPDAQAEEGARDRAERAADIENHLRRPPPGLSSLSVTDSFILRQLRGWRLLSGAHLSTEDVRSVMASTNNRLDYDNISVALTILFDEQLQSTSRHGGQHGPQMFTLEEDSWEDESWHGWDPWANASQWWTEDDSQWSYYEPEAEIQNMAVKVVPKNKELPKVNYKLLIGRGARHSALPS